jgi:hypothetical protein|nr:MAG TPA: Protein of unknown function (DUF551) [Caudoviricetes sp.]
MEWVSVKDRLPEEPGTYLVSCVSNGPYFCGTHTITAQWNGKCWWRTKYQKFTHWMPMPEPVKE